VWPGLDREEYFLQAMTDSNSGRSVDLVSGLVPGCANVKNRAAAHANPREKK
jgi:hypothetical protein